MLPITRANLQNFCRICLRDISNVTEVHKVNEMPQTNKFLPQGMCSNCFVKLCALRQFRSKAIIGAGVLRLIVDEERHNTAGTIISTLSKLQSICRICLKDQKLTSYSARDKNQANDILECIGLNTLQVSEQKCSRDVLRDDAFFPDKLCSKCFTTIKSFIEFRKLSKQTVEYLRNVFDEQESSYVNNFVEEEVFSAPTDFEINIGTSVLKKSKSFESILEFNQCSNLTESTCNESLHFDNNFSSEKELENVADKDLTECKIEKFPSDHEEFTNASNEKPSVRSKKDLSTKKEKRFKAEKDINEKESAFFEDVKHDSGPVKMEKQRAPRNLQKAFKCNECNKSFYKKFMYEAHIKSVHEHVEKPFACPHCQKSFRLVQVLHRHLSCCHENNVNKNESEQGFRRACHICLFCQKPFKRKERLKQHISAVHEKLRPFKCGVCGKTFGTKNTQMRHEKNHSIYKPYSCEYCAKRYNSESELKVHIQRHVANPALLCPICKRAKQTIEELEKHISMHKRSYQCTTCGKLFKKMVHLREHESTVHLKLRSLKCGFCDLTFIVRKTLKNHEKSHNSIGRPEKCPLCHLNFKSKRALSLHTKKMHVKEN